MNTLIVSVTRTNLKDFLDKSQLWKSISTNNKEDIWLPINNILKNTSFVSPTFYQPNSECLKFKNTDVIVITENKEGLSLCYNFILDYVIQYLKYDSIIFIHDDVTIKSSDMIEQLEKGFDDGNSVLGLAGASKIELKEPALWHLMSLPDNWSGEVYHPNYTVNKYGIIEKINDDIILSKFGPVPQRCLVIDCLFIAIKVKDILDKKIQFDTQFDFHCVDLDFSLTCNKNNLKISTVPILVCHESPGLRSLANPIFRENQRKFLQKWKAN